MYSAIFRSMIFPALEFYQGTTIQHHLAELQKSQWWSKEQIEDLQNRKLRKLIRHAYDNVPYYHRLFSKLGITPEEIRTKNDLNKLPVLSKENIRKNLPDLIARNVPRSQIIETHSSGSTGEPVKYYIDKESYSTGWAQTFRCWSWAGFQLGDPYVKISLNPRTTVKKKIQDAILNTDYIYASGITENTILREIQKIKKINPSIIRGYASYLFTLSKLMEKKGIEYSGASIMTTGDTLYPHYRETIEKQFNGKIFDGYGGESTPISFECEEHQGYHVCDEDVIVEFFKDDEHVVSGELGKIIMTNLNNHVMPFIRYTIGDIGTFTDESCSCGRGLSLMKSIEGRDSDLITTPHGEIVVVQFFTVLFKNIEGVEQFQIIQEKVDDIIIKIVKNSKFSDNDFQHIKNQIRQKVGPEVNLTIDFVDDIPIYGRSGKRRFVISKVPFKT